MADRESELQKIISDARTELSRIERNRAIKENQNLIGRFFKYRNNYSCPRGPEDYWWLYTAVIDVSEASIITRTFQKDTYGKIEIEPRGSRPAYIGGYLEITREEYLEAWESLQAELTLISEV